MKKSLYLIFCFLCLFNCKKEEKREVSLEAVEIKNSLLKQKKLFDVPGISFGLIKNNKILYSGAHGVKSKDTKEPLKTNSVFHMASVSKPFVATAIIQLVEQGKIDLNGKLINYLPYYTMNDENYRDITIKQMLAHTSGIPNTSDYEWDNPQYDDGAAERYARSQKTVKLDFVPGKKYSYSNPAFDILCDVIAKTSGLTFEDYMKKNIFDPIGMKHSTFFKPDVPKNLATQPHVLGDSLQIVVSEIYPYNRRHAGSSTLHSNIDDMLLWAKVNLNKGSINGKQIYSRDSYDVLTEIHTPKGQRKVCLSWFFRNLNDSPVFFHSGNDVGFKSFFGFMPEKKSAFVMMVNTDEFWTTDNVMTIVENSIFNDSIAIKGPIHYKLKNYILEDGIEKVKEVYYTEQQKEQKDYTFDNGDMDDFGYWLLDRNHLKEALEIFTFNTELEPEHAGWVDSVGDAYRKMDSTNLAIECYKKALEMKPDQEFSRRKLNALMLINK